MYAVFDANNFYVSCERVVQPKLNNIPVVVANPGGIILARSNEAKALGINMAAPLFKIEDLLKAHNVTVIPTHFSLYADLSSRIVTILHENFPFIEEYSIDESFVYFPSELKQGDIEKACKKVRAQILKWTGVPVSVGIAQTKTLSKVAVKLAKKMPEGVMSIVSDTERLQILEKFPVNDIWGVGWALSKKLPAYGITTALHLSQQDPIQFRKRFSVTLAYTVNELNGISCFTVDSAPGPAKSLMCTESYHEEITTAGELETRLLLLARRAGRQLRKQKEVAGGMGIFVRGNRFHKEKGYLALQELTIFQQPTAYTPFLTKFVSQAVTKIFFEGARIKRAGIFLLSLMPKDHRQYGLFETENATITEKDDLAMQAIDRIDRKWGKKGQRKGIFATIQV